MHRQPLLMQLQKYAVDYPDEQETVDRFAHFVSTYPECFERSLTIGHVTGSAWVVNATNTHALFTHHRKIGKWLQLGGHADGESDLAQVSLREAKEESGLSHVQLTRTAIFDIDIHTIPARKNEPEHEHYDVRYWLQGNSDETVQVSDESFDLAWFSLEEIYQRLQDESILRMAGKWLGNN